MKNVSVGITKPNTKKYPLHRHNNWEIMYYLTGEGYLATEGECVGFHPGSIIIVPPNILHGSVSKDGFVNISIGENFNKLFQFNEIVAVEDNASKDGERLAKLIYENRYADVGYLSALCNAYAYFLLQNIECQKPINRAVNYIVKSVFENFQDSSFNITTLLNNSGYTEDYIRAEFKKITDYSPIDFLTKVRIERAQKLFEIYGEGISVLEIATACGFDDPVYFSRRFKQFTNISPSEYKKRPR